MLVGPTALAGMAFVNKSVIKLAKILPHRLTMHGPSPARGGLFSLIFLNIFLHHKTLCDKLAKALIEYTCGLAQNMVPFLGLAYCLIAGPGILFSSFLSL